MSWNHPRVTFSTEVPVISTIEVLVVGGGPAGIAAAVASARTGARTMLVERYGFLGGMSTAGLVGPFMTSFSADGRVQVIRGLFDEIVARMEHVGGAIHPRAVRAGSSHASFIVWGQDHVTPFDPEAMKLVAQHMVQEAGVDLLLHSFFMDVRMTGSNITEVFVVNKSGVQAIHATCVVDCTGDADVAARAGVPFEKGREPDGLMQPATMYFRVRNVDSAKVAQYVQDHPEDARSAGLAPFFNLVAKARANGQFPVDRDTINLHETNRSGEWRVNGTRLHGVDGTDVVSLTEAEVDGRDQAMQLLEFLRTYVPGFEGAELVDTATQIGIRETRRIRGEYTLTADDILHGTKFNDCVALCGFPIDIHDPEGKRDVFMLPDGVIAYEIPYRCLVPLRVENLLVAGRSVSATHEAIGAIRVMPACVAMGQAAGTAAALSVRLGVVPRCLDPAILRRQLAADGVCLEIDNREG